MLGLARDLSSLVASLPRSRSHSLRELGDLSSCDLFTAIETVMEDSHKGISRVHCPHCSLVDRFRITHGLLPRHSLKRLRYMLAPQLIPRGLRDLGEELYRKGPYSISMGTFRSKRIIIPIMDGLTVPERQKLFETVLRLRAEERRTGSYTSIHLDQILIERGKMAQTLAGNDLKICPLSVFASVGLLRLYPLLYDDRIAEFYVDREGSFAYVDHRDLGRCLSAVYVGANDMKRLITFARMASGKALDYSSPSLRVSLNTAGFNGRISVDAPPLSLEGTSLSCRKFFTSPLTMNELASNGTLPPALSKFLEDEVRRRSNITIYGESGSGKTTLAIALDLLTPSGWRKFSVESDVAENVSQSRMGRHQVRLLAAGATPDEQAKRTHVLNSLLHKSPDYIFLGEVLSKEDSESLFQILAAGLRCIHTVHAESAEGLMRRWINQHGIQPSSLHCLGLLIQMEKRLEGERVARCVSRVSRVEAEPGSREPPLLSEIYRKGTGPPPHSENAILPMDIMRSNGRGKRGGS